MSAAGPRTRARFPELEESAGHYESLYLKAADPAGGRALWLRHTVHRRPGRPATAALWLTWFDRARGRPRAGKLTVPAEQLRFPPGAYIRVAESELGPACAEGSLETDALTASWSLRYEDLAEPLWHLPHERMYTLPLPRTKPLSPHPNARFSGTVTIDGERIELERWPGMVGHNWGGEHAETWVWLHGVALGGEEDSYIDVVAGRVRLGPLTTPWVTNGMLVLEGDGHRLGGIGRAPRTRIAAGPGVCEFTIPGERARVRGRASAPLEQTVAWVYADPKGPEHHSLNCSIADLELEVERPGRPPARLRLEGTAAYELGTRDFAHGVPVEPYPDG
jgi:hypothetical protein